MTRTRAALLLALAALMFSSGGLTIKVVDLNPISIVGARGAITALVLWLYMRRPKFTPKFIWSVAQLGAALGVAGAQFFFVLATKQTTAANAVFIQFSAPIYVALLGTWLLNERVKPADWLSMLFVFTGLGFFFMGDLNISGLWGNINALISGISLAFFFVFMRMQKDGSVLESIFLGNVLCALCLPLLFTETPSLADWGGLLFLGFFQMSIPFIILSTSIKYMTALEAIIIQTLEPILNPIWVFLAIGERPTALAFVGCFIVFATVFARSLRLRDKVS